MRFDQFSLAVLRIDWDGLCMYFFGYLSFLDGNWKRCLRIGYLWGVGNRDEDEEALFDSCVWDCRLPV